MNGNKINVRVWGDWACFTRPEMKVERVSYPLMTPSAARGLLEAIFWEPQVYYLVDSIRVVRRGRWVSFRRNEVTANVSMGNARQWMAGTREVTPIQAGGGAPDGTQRNMLALEDVEYVITAEMRLTDLGRRAEQTLAKYRAEVERRARVGKCFHRPYLGVREFAADFEWEGDAGAALRRRRDELGEEWREWADEDLGLMLYDLFDSGRRAAGFRWLKDEELRTKTEGLKPAESKRLVKQEFWDANGEHVGPAATFFRARVRESKLDCHPDRIDLIRRNGGEN